MWKKALSVGPWTIPPEWRYNFTPDGGCLIYWYNQKQTGPDQILAQGTFVTITLTESPNNLELNAMILYADLNQTFDNYIKNDLGRMVPNLVWSGLSLISLRDPMVDSREELKVWAEIRKVVPYVFNMLMKEAKSVDPARPARIPSYEIIEAMSDIDVKNTDKMKMELYDDKLYNSLSIAMGGGGGGGQADARGGVGGAGGGGGGSVIGGNAVMPTASGQISMTAPMNYLASGAITRNPAFGLVSGAIGDDGTLREFLSQSSPTIDRARAEEQQRIMANTRPTPPENPVIGNIWTDTNTGKIRVWTGTTWLEITPITDEQAQSKVPDWLVPPKPKLPLIGRKIMDNETA